MFSFLDRETIRFTSTRDGSRIPFGGAPTLQGGRPPTYDEGGRPQTYDFTKFCKKKHEIEKILGHLSANVNYPKHKVIVVVLKWGICLGSLNVRWMRRGVPLLKYTIFMPEEQLNKENFIFIIFIRAWSCCW